MKCLHWLDGLYGGSSGLSPNDIFSKVTQALHFPSPAGQSGCIVACVVLALASHLVLEFIWGTWNLTINKGNSPGSSSSPLPHLLFFVIFILHKIAQHMCSWSLLSCMKGSNVDTLYFAFYPSHHLWNSFPLILFHSCIVLLSGPGSVPLFICLLSCVWASNCFQEIPWCVYILWDQRCVFRSDLVTIVGAGSQPPLTPLPLTLCDCRLHPLPPWRSPWRSCSSSRRLWGGSCACSTALNG